MEFTRDAQAFIEAAEVISKQCPEHEQVIIAGAVKMIKDVLEMDEMSDERRNKIIAKAFWEIHRVHDMTSVDDVNDLLGMLDDLVSA